MSRTRKGTMRSKMLIDKINDMKMKLGSKLTLRKTGKTKVYSEISAKVVNLAKRKRVEEVMEMGQDDDRMPGTERTLSDVMMVPRILMAGLGSASYKTKGSDHLASCLNHGKGNVVGQLIPVEHNRLTVSETVSVDEPAVGYMEMLEYRSLARGHLIALENKVAMEDYLEDMIQSTAMKQKANGTLFSTDRTVGEFAVGGGGVTSL